MRSGVTRAHFLLLARNERWLRTVAAAALAVHAKPEAKRYPSTSVRHAPNPGPTPEALAHGGVVGCNLKTRPGALGRLLSAGLITEDEQRIGEAFRRLMWSWRCQAGVRLPWMAAWSALPQIIRTEEQIITRWQETTAWLHVSLRALCAQPQEVRTVVGRVVMEDVLPAHHHELAALRVGLAILTVCLPGV